MDIVIPVIIAVLSTAIVSIGGTFLFTRRPNKNPLYTQNSRQVALGGRWEGTALQKEGPEGGPLEIRLTITLEATHQYVRGEGEMRYFYQGQEVSEYLSFVNGSLIDDWFKIEYQEKEKPEQIQFGYALLKVSGNGKRLEGCFLGFGALPEKPVYGTIQFHRPDSVLAHTPASIQPTMPNIRV